MIIHPEPVWTQLAFEPGETEVKLVVRNFIEELQASVPKERHVAHELTNRSDLFDVRLLSGFVPWLLETLELRGFAIEFAEDRLVPHIDFKAIERLTLRPYQKGAIKAVPRNYGRGIWQLPTGAGKTRTAAGLILGYPTQWLFLVHRKTLLEQTIESFKELGLNAWSKRDQAQGGKGLGPDVVVATYQSLVNSEEIVRWANGLIVDEAHRAAGRSYFDLLLKCPAEIRIGLSATPLLRSDRRDVLTVGALGPIIYAETPRALVKAGYLSPGEVFFHEHTCAEAPSDRGSWGEAYRRVIVDDPERNDLISDVVTDAEFPCLVLVKELDHGKILEKLFRDDGMRAAFVEGRLGSKARRAAIDDLTSGALQVVIATSIFDEGVDIPALRTVVVGAGGKAAIPAMQRLGRAIRKSEGKKDFVLHDFTDNGHTWFENHALERAEAYGAVGFKVSGIEARKTESDFAEEDELEEALRQTRKDERPQDWDGLGIVERAAERRLTDEEKVDAVAEQVGDLAGDLGVMVLIAFLVACFLAWCGK